MKQLIIFTLSLALHHQAFSQNNIRFSQLNFVQGVNNPAALALDGRVMVDMIFRNQWFGIDGAPTTVAVNGQYELMDDMAVGLNVYHDQIGVDQTTSISGQYAYRIFLENRNAIAFGLGLGVDNKIADYASASTIVANDPAFSGSFSRVLFNSSVGMYYYAPRFYFGLSIPQMFQSDFGRKGADLKTQFHYYLSTGLYLDAGENFTFNPHIQVKTTQNAPIAGDLVLRNTIMGRFSLVVGYRTENSLIAGVDMLITPFIRAGYSFNHDIGPLARTKGMSNELYVGIALPYNNSREDFGKRRYINNGGGFMTNYKRNYKKGR